MSPDEFLVFKPLMKKGFKSIVDKKLGVKDKKMVYSSDRSKMTEIVKSTDEDFKHFCIDDKMVMKLADWVQRIEEHYSQKKGGWCPMDTEWAVDGESGELFIV